MRRLPRVNDSLLVRTDFSDERAWTEICAESGSVHGAYVVPVSDRAFDLAPWKEVRAAVPAGDTGAAVLFIADAETMTARGHPVLAVSLSPGDGAPFRCVTAALAAVEDNLNSASLGWADFVSQAEPDGVFRGWLPGSPRSDQTGHPERQRAPPESPVSTPGAGTLAAALPGPAG